jgi:mRNA interferase MazF
LGLFIKGDVVVVPFPFSDLSGSKKRPALVVANLPGDDIILCQITSQPYDDTYSIPLDHTDFKEGELKSLSFVRPNKLFTSDSQIVEKSVAHILPSTMEKVTDKIIQIIKE